MKKIVTIIYIITVSSLFCNTINDIIDQSIRFNNWEEAKKQIEVYIKSNKSDSYAYSLYSSVLLELKLYDEAIIALRNSVNYEKSDEKRGELYFNIANIYYNKGQKDIAIEMYLKSTEFNKMLASPYYMLGLIYYERNNIEECLKNWKRYVSLTTDFEKMEKVEKVIQLIEKDIEEKRIAEQKRIEEEKRLREEEEKRLAEEKRKKEEEEKIRLENEKRLKEEEEKRLAEEKRKKDEEERIRLEEEKRRKEEEEKRLAEDKRKREEMLNSLKDLLINDKKDSKSLEEYKIKKKNKDTELEEIQ